VSSTDQELSPAPTVAVQAEHVKVAAIDTRETFLQAVHDIAAGYGPIAVDAERASGFRYSQRAYLIQMFRRGAGTFLFDPPAIGSLGELNDAIRDEEWIFHAASQDLACLREVGLDPVRIFDTELGARLAGLPRVGLGTIVESLLGVHLAKEHSAADWSTRPLPQSWLVYAALDVELLVDLREAVAELLRADDKTELAEQEFAAELVHKPKPANPEAWRRLSGLHSIRSPQGLAVARELWLTRDTYARHIDTAPGRLVPDSSLVAAAKAMPATKRELAALREFNGRASRTQLPMWWAAIETGRTTEDLPSLRVSGDTIPPARAWSDRNPDADKRLKHARAAFAAVSERLNIPVENLLTPHTLRQLAWSPPEDGVDGVRRALAELGARTWQIDATAQTIADAFVEARQPAAESPETSS
jgi:ribonuclease D